MNDEEIKKELKIQETILKDDNEEGLVSEKDIYYRKGFISALKMVLNN